MVVGVGSPSSGDGSRRAQALRSRGARPQLRWEPPPAGMPAPPGCPPPAFPAFPACRAFPAPPGPAVSRCVARRSPERTGRARRGAGRAGMKRSLLRLCRARDKAAAASAYQGVVCEADAASVASQDVFKVRGRQG